MSVTDQALDVVKERPAPPQALATMPPPAAPAAVFTADDAGSVRSPEYHAQAGFLSELALHQAVATPLSVGLFGPAGAGKSSLLDATLQAAGALGQAAETAGLATPFLAGAAILKLSVQPGQNPSAALLQQAFSALGTTHPNLVAEAGQSHHDPHAAARDAGDRLDVARQRLDGERRKLDELEARQARLVDGVLFESAGSRVDTYARSNRTRIDRSLRGFGFEGDTTATYKELVRDTSETTGPLGRGFSRLPALWAYRGQTRLILVALGFLVVFWLLGLLIDNLDGLLASLRSGNDRMGPTADWLAAHSHWLDPARQIVGLAALAALAINILRAVRFIQPIARGATLLHGDLEARRRDLDGLLAHQTHRVDALAREVETARARTEEAESRLGAQANDGATSRLPAFTGLPVDDVPAEVAAARFFSTVANAVARRGRGDDAPSRLIVGLDGFERVSSREAAAYIDAARMLLARPGIVTILAADRPHLASGIAETDPALATAVLDRMVQVPIRIGDDGESWSGARRLVETMMQPHAAPTDARIVTTPDASHSVFDMPWLAEETSMLGALAPFAGGTPRAVKRFVNLYRVARADPTIAEASAQERAALALGLALQGRGALPPASLMANGVLDEEWKAGRDAAEAALGTTLDLGRAARGFEVARRYASV